MKKYLIAVSTLGILTLLPFSCKKTADSSCNTSPTYTSDIKKIIDASCAISGCHVAGSPNGVFTTYAGLSKVISSGDLKRQVITNKTMPQNGSLSSSDYSKMNCWVQNNYAE
jgi:hypothetical protein